MIRPLAFSLAQRFAESAILLIALAVLARLLAPEAFGLFATAYAPLVLVEGFCRTGASATIVRLDRLDDGRATSAALFAVAAAALGAAVLCLLALVLARAPGVDPAIASVLLPLLLGRIVLVPLRTVAESILMRSLAFDALCGLGIAAALCNAATAITLAAGGAGAEALAFGALAEGLALALGTAFVARKDLRGLRHAPVAFARIARAAGQVSTGGALNDLGNVVATTTATLVLGATATGLYDRARRVIGGFDDLLMNAVRPIVLPLLSERRRQGSGIGQAYRFKTAAISGVAWPFFGALAILAEPTVRVLLGPGWSEAVPVVRVLCLVGITAPFHMTDGQFLIALGRERDYLAIQLQSQIASVGLILLAAPHGLPWLAAAAVSGKAVKACLTTRILRRELGVTIGDLTRATLPSFFTGATTCLAVAAVQASGLGEGRAPGVLLVVASLGAAPVFVAAAAGTRHPLWREAREILRRRLAERH